MESQCCPLRVRMHQLLSRPLIPVVPQACASITCASMHHDHAFGVIIFCGEDIDHGVLLVGYGTGTARFCLVSRQAA